MAAGDYRPDIDGLRALAIVSVIFFHTGSPVFAGGFVGVEVFFPVSGYLITRIILGQHEAGRFSFRDFYLRRVRRLFPALIATLVLCLLAAALLFAPFHMERLARSSLATLSFVGNVYFWSEFDLHGEALEFKPLLHTWSLAVEEQFYVLWPAALAGLLALRRPWAVPAFLIVASLASFIASEIYLHEDSNGAYLLTPFRAFELGMGALCVYAGFLRPRSPVLAEAMTVTGILMILVPMATYKLSMPYPGFNALVPTIGTCLIILAGDRARWSPLLLSNRACVGIGLVSYSLYLLHWPLFQFYEYARVEPISVVEYAVLIAMSLALAVLMYRTVELPFRYPPRQQPKPANRRFLLASAGLATVFIAVALSGARQGWPDRFQPDIAQALLLAGSDRSGERFGELIDKQAPRRAGQPHALLIGNERAYDIRDALLSGGTRYWLSTMWLHARCQPIAGRDHTGRCGRAVDALVESAELAQADLVIIATDWRWPAVRGIARTIRTIKSRTDAPIMVFGPSAQYPDVAVMLAQHRRSEGFEELAQAHMSQHPARLDRSLRDELAGQPAGYIGVMETFCPAGRCPVLTPEARLVLSDGENWTPEGAALFGAALKMSGHPAAAMLFAAE